MMTTIVCVSVSESEQKRLLAAVGRAVGGLEAAKEARREAVRAAVVAGVPRQRIADELGLTRHAIYKIVSGD